MKRKVIVAAALAGALVGGGLGITSVTAVAEPVGAVAQSEAVGPINTAGLTKAMSGLPSDRATAALVAIGGEDRWEKATGVRDLDSGKAAKLGNRVRIGSVTKVFNAAIVLQLVAENKITLTDTVQDHLPRLLPADYPEVTIGQLLNHTSGLPAAQIDGFDEFAWQYEHRFDRWEPQEFLKLGFKNPMQFEPGTRQDYSNVNNMISGLIIEKVTHSTWEKQLSRRIAKPLELKDTYAPGHATRIKGAHQHGYQLVGSEYVDTTVWNQSSTWAAGDMVSTVDDLRTFTESLFAGDVVPSKQLKNMFTVPDVAKFDPDNPDMDDPATLSMGLDRKELPGGLVVWGKSGARVGYSNGIGGLTDGSRILAYSVNNTNAKGDDQTSHPVMSGIIASSFGF